MSGEQRVGIAALFALITIFVVLLLAAAVSAEEKKEDDSRPILDEANTYQNLNGSWGEDIEVTYKMTVANAGNTVDFDGIVVPNEYSLRVTNALNWTFDSYDVKIVSVETQGLITRDDWGVLYNIGGMKFKDFQDGVEGDLISFQDTHGSWNNDVDDTAMAVYGLSATKGENELSIDSGVQWIRKQEDEDEYSWGTISSDSKAILALQSAGIDVREEIEALIEKQNPDGSFGGIEETSWAVIALSTSLNEEIMERMERAMQWLRSQEYDNNEDLANAALAEEYYEKALDSWDPPDNDGDGLINKSEKEAGSILTPLYIISICIISAAVLGYLLFARLEKDDALSGVRKDLYSYIEMHPGEHLANITKTFDLSSSSARYHLSVLEGMDQIVSHKNGKYKRFYINKNGYSKYTNGNGYKHIMSALKNVTARKIVKFILSHPNTNQKSVSNALKIHPSTVNWHAERLREAEVLSKSKKGKEIVYSLNEDVQVRKVIGILEGSIA